MKVARLRTGLAGALRVGVSDSDSSPIVVVGVAGMTTTVVDGVGCVVSVVARVTVNGVEVKPSLPHCETATSAAVRPSVCPSCSVPSMVTVAVPSSAEAKSSVAAGVNPSKAKSRRASPLPVVGGVQLVMVAVISVPIGPDVGLMEMAGAPAWLDAGATPTSPTAEDANNAARTIRHLDIGARVVETACRPIAACGNVSGRALGARCRQCRARNCSIPL